MPDTSPWTKPSLKFETTQLLNNVIALGESVASLGTSGLHLEISLPTVDFRTVATALLGEMDCGRAMDMGLDQAWQRGYFIVNGVKIKERRANESPWSDCTAGDVDRAGIGG